MKLTLTASLSFVTAALLTAIAVASSGDIPLSEVDLDENNETLKRGAQVALNSCVMCHDLKYIKFRSLKEIGFSKREIDALRGPSAMNDPVLSFNSPEIAKKLFGMVPPDLSLMAKARKGGIDYIYTLLTSYSLNSEGVVENHLFPGIKMPDPFAYSIRTSGNARQEIESKAASVSVFLKWAADPRASERRNMGYYVIAYLVVLTFLFYLLKRKVWRDLK